MLQNRQRIIELIEKVRLPDAENILGRYPHELSGGQKQRVALARGLVNRPRLLLLGDAAGYVEPFTGEGMAWGLTAATLAAPLASSGIRASKDMTNVASTPALTTPLRPSSLSSR